MISSEILTEKDGMSMIQNDDLLPKIEKASSISEEVKQKYDNMLRSHFLYGSRISSDIPKSLFPIQSTFQMGNPIESPYPIVYNSNPLDIQSLNDVILAMINEIFDEYEKETLIQTLPSLLEKFHERLLSQNMIHGC